MALSERGLNYMGGLEARQEAGRYIATFVPESSIHPASDINTAMLRAHVASEHTAQMQGPGTTTLEPYKFDDSQISEAFQKRIIVEELGLMGDGDLRVLANRLNAVEAGAGEYARAFAHKIATNTGNLSTEGTIQRALEDETLRTLHDRAGSIVGNLRAGMSDSARELRQETHSKIGNPLDKYELVDRRERFRHTDDNRTPIITGTEVYKILQDLASEGKYKIVGGYKHLVDLFTGTLKGAQERMYLDSKFSVNLRRAD